MSNTDSFIQEVTEEVRRDKLFGLVRRYGWIAALLVVGIVGGAAWNEWNKARRAAEAQTFGDAVLSALESPDSAGRIAALNEIDADGGRQALVRLMIAAEAVDTGDTDRALAALSAIVGDAGLPQRYRQIAELKRVVLAGPAIPMSEREQVLSGLAQPGGPLRPLAMEQIAMLRIEAGEPAAALAILRDLLEEPDVTPGLRRRVSQAIVALGGDATAAG